MKKGILILLLSAVAAGSVFAQTSRRDANAYRKEGYKLIWSDEFNKDGRPDPSKWSYEKGFERNHEAQYYQRENVECKDGLLIFEGRKERRVSFEYDPNGRGWDQKPLYAEYTSASINTRGKFAFRYGRMEVRAKIPAEKGSWPAIWLLGKQYPWPHNGEIDVMEYYHIGGKPHILANAAWGGKKQYEAIWDDEKIPYSHFTDKEPDWADKFHIWRMDWDEEAIRIYLDGELLNEILLSETINEGSRGEGFNPFTQEQYILLNLAMGGNNGGPIDDSALPLIYEVDYVRVYQK
ncbi:MAG: glycoside hydrolase family 16 protein [Alistipes sp.]|nr:glycoside hydrolase family 16 protein [Alistipes sp.]